MDLMSFTKVNKIDGLSVGKLKSSLRGLISLINEENKLIIFEQS